MEMLLKVSTLVLLTAVIMVISAQRPVILDESPSSVKIALGCSETLRCSFKIEPHVQAEQRIRVDWYLNPSQSSNKLSHKLSTEVFSISTKQDLKDRGPHAEKTWSNFTLSNAALNDSGRYFCKVTLEIPHYGIAYSNGTQVHVTDSKMEHTTFRSLPKMTAKQVTVSPTVSVLSLDWWMWTVLGGLSFILIVVVVYICTLVRRRARRITVTECPVYANTHPVGSANRRPSPRLEVQLDNLKTVPPSHHLRTPSPARRYEGRRNP